MGNLKCTIILMIAGVLSGCKPGNQQKAPDKLGQEIPVSISGNFSISGAYALCPLVRKWAADFMKIHPEIRIETTENGTGEGINDLLDGKVQLAMISRPLTDDEAGAGLWTVPVAKDGVAPIVNRENPYIKRILDQGMSPDEFLKAFTTENTVSWGDLIDTVGSEKVIVFTRSDESGAADVFAEFLFKRSSDLKGIRVSGDDEMIKSVQENKFSLGFCNFSYAFNPSTGERINGIQILPVDLDFDNKVDKSEEPYTTLEKAHRSLWLGLYPKNLCRELTIGSLGKPTDAAVNAFLKYILTEGQGDIQSSGLCKLNDVYVEYSLEKLK